MERDDVVRGNIQVSKGPSSALLQLIVSRQLLPLVDGLGSHDAGVFDRWRHTMAKDLKKDTKEPSQLSMTLITGMINAAWKWRLSLPDSFQPLLERLTKWTIQQGSKSSQDGLGDYVVSECSKALFIWKTLNSLQKSSLDVNSRASLSEIFLALADKTISKDCLQNSTSYSQTEKDSTHIDVQQRRETVLKALTIELDTDLSGKNAP